MKLKLDLHVHTSRSKDAFTRPDELESLCRLKSLDGVAITDHNMLCEQSPKGVVGIRGVEVSSADGHIIGLGLAGPVQSGLTADDTIREIHRLRGLAIVPHPYDLFRSSVNPDLLSIRPDAIEVVNSSSIMHSISWSKAKNFAEKKGIPSVAGSDSHIPQTLGMAFTIVDNDGANEADVLGAIRAGNVIPVGRTIKLSHRIRKLILQVRRSH